LLQFFGVHEAVFLDGCHANRGNNFLVHIPSAKKHVCGRSTGSWLIASTLADHFLYGIQGESARCFYDVAKKCVLLLQVRINSRRKCVAG